MTITIHRGGEIMPPYKGGRPPKYDLDGMDVGDWFLMPAGAATTDITPLIAYRRRARGWDRVYRTRTIDGRVKVQRVK